MTINRRRFMSWVLVLSLGINLLVAGGITSRILSRPDGRPIPPNLSWIMNSLDDEVAEAKIRPQMEEFGRIMWPLRGAMFRAQRHVNELMIEEPMDRGAIAAAFDELRQASLEYQETTHQQTIAIFALLTPEQRRQAMSFMTNRRNPMDGRSRDGSNDDQRPDRENKEQRGDGR